MQAKHVIGAIAALVVLVLLVSILEGAGVVIAIVVGVVVLLRLLPENVTGWKR
jgi:hypothetical protein